MQTVLVRLLIAAVFVLSPLGYAQESNQGWLTRLSNQRRSLIYDMQSAPLTQDILNYADKARTDYIMELNRIEEARKSTPSDFWRIRRERAQSGKKSKSSVPKRFQDLFFIKPLMSEGTTLIWDNNNPSGNNNNDHNRIQIEDPRGLPIYALKKTPFTQTERGEIAGYTTAGEIYEPDAVIRKDGRTLLYISADSQAVETRDQDYVIDVTSLDFPDEQLQRNEDSTKFFHPSFTIRRDWAKDQPLYLDVKKQNQAISVFKRPGKTWGDCQAQIDSYMSKEAGDENSYCEAAWPKPSDNPTITYRSTQLAETKDAISGRVSLRTFYEVDLEYEKSNGEIFKETVWIDSKNLSTTPVEYDEHGKKCDPVTPPTQEINELNEIAEAATEESFNDFLNFANQTQEYFGKCPVGNNASKEQIDAAINRSTHPFEDLHKARFTDRSGNLIESGMPKFNGKSISPEQSLAIASLAATYLGEMGNKVRRAEDRDYVRLVGRSMLNRRDYALGNARAKTDKLSSVRGLKNFVSDRSVENYKDMDPNLALTYVLGARGLQDDSRHQYEAWDKNNVNVSKMICPLAKHLGSQQRSAWKYAVALAAEAVLTPNYLSSTPGANNTYFYTSGTKPSWTKCLTQQTTISVENRVLELDPKDLMYWSGDPPVAGCKAPSRATSDLESANKFIALIASMGLHRGF